MFDLTGESRAPCAQCTAHTLSKSLAQVRPVTMEPERYVRVD